MLIRTKTNYGNKFESMSYPTKKLGDCLAQFDRGISWSRKDEGGTVAVLRIPNIQEGHINLDDLKHISAKNGNGELHKNDIVMVASNGNPDLVGRSALVTEKEKGMRFASFLVRLRLDNTKLLSHYAHLFLLTPTFKRELRRKIATTSGIYNLRKEHVEKIEIPLPPLTTQKQIVERLDKITEAQKLNDGLIQKTDELFQSLLHEKLNPHTKNFGVGVNPAGPADAKAMAGKKDWGVKKLGDLVEVKGGKRVPKGMNFSPIKTDHPYLRVTDFVDGSIDMGNLKYIDEKIFEHIKRYIISSRDIYISIAGTIGLVGKVPKELEGANLTENAAKLLINDKIIDKDFLIFSLSTNKAKNQIKIFTQAVGVPKLALERIEKIKISLPPLKIQKQIVAKLSAVQDYKKQLLEQKAKLKELFDSALAKSMSKDA